MQWHRTENKDGSVLYMVVNKPFSNVMTAIGIKKDQQDCRIIIYNEFHNTDFIDTFLKKRRINSEIDKGHSEQDPNRFFIAVNESNKQKVITALLELQAHYLVESNNKAPTHANKLIFFKKSKTYSFNHEGTFTDEHGKSLEDQFKSDIQQKIAAAEVHKLGPQSSG